MTAELIPIQIFETAELLSEATAQEILRLIQNKCEEPTGIMLAGGRTPLAAYEIVARTSSPAPGGLHAFFSDERRVPFDSPDNNANNARVMLDALQIPEGNVHRVNTALPVDEAASAYDRELDRFLDRGGRIPLGFLGLGADGHTASLFSRQDVERGADCLALAVRREEGPDRVSVTPRLLSRIERLLFLVSGEEKREIVQTLREKPKTIPAGLAVSGHPNTQVWFASESQTG